MSSQEIVSLQFGPVSNFAGTHFWNIQEELFYQYHAARAADGDNVPETDLSSLFHYTDSNTHVPRLVAFGESPDSFGHLVGSRALLRARDKVSALEQLSQAVDTWSTAGMEVIVRPSRASSSRGEVGPASDTPSLYASWMRDIVPMGDDAILGSLMHPQSYGPPARDGDDSDEDGEEEGETSKRRQIRSLDDYDRRPAEPQSYGLEALKRRREEYLRDASAAPPAPAKPDVTYDSLQAELASRPDIRWSDFLKSTLHSMSVAPLQPSAASTPAGEPRMDASYRAGSAALKKSEKREEMLNRSRFFVEQCDHLQGFQVLADVRSGFGGLAEEYLTLLKDDFGEKIPIMLYGCSRKPPSAAETAAGGPRNDQQRSYSHDLLNELQAFTALRKLASVYVPLSTSRCRKMPFLSINDDLRFHLTAPMGALMSLTLTPTVLSRRDVQTPMRAFTDAMVVYPNCNIATAALGLPLHVLRQDSAFDVLQRIGGNFCYPSPKSLVEMSLRRSAQHPGNPHSLSAVVSGLGNMPLYNRGGAPATSAAAFQVSQPSSAARFASASDRHLTGCLTHSELFENSVKASSGRRQRNYTAVSLAHFRPQPFYVPDSFPAFFGETVTEHGFVDSPVSRDAGSRVRSLATMSVLQTSPRVGAYAYDLSRHLERCVRGRVAHGIVPDEAAELREELEGLRTDYGDDEEQF